MRIIHRDLKSSNIFVDNSGQGKVAGFGKARKTISGSDMSTMTITGTWLWMAPEIVRNERYNSKYVYST